jgi:calcineurin-like phosphoesterase family protein
LNYYTSDTHFQHENVIRLCDRPFANLEEMHEAIIQRWNERVRPCDDVWHQGDFALGQQQNIPDLVARLNGRVHLCFGNHDNRKKIVKMGCFASVQDVAVVKDGEDRVFLSHYAHRVWDRSHYGVYHLFGHSHGGLPPQGRSLDVGVDSWDFRPVTLVEVKERLAEAGTIDDYGYVRSMRLEEVVAAEH